MILNTPSGGEARGDGYEIRAAAVSVGTPCITTVAEFGAADPGHRRDAPLTSGTVTSLQEHAKTLQAAGIAEAEQQPTPRTAPMPSPRHGPPRRPGAPFGQRLAAAMAAHGPLCVGIDPHPALLAAWGLSDDVARAAQLLPDRRRGRGRARRGPEAAGGAV